MEKDKDRTDAELYWKALQNVQAAVPSVGDAREDWRIIRAISEVIGQQLPYDTIDGLRKRMAEVAPHMGHVDHVEAPIWLNGEYFKVDLSNICLLHCLWYIDGRFSLAVWAFQSWHIISAAYESLKIDKYQLLWDPMKRFSVCEKEAYGRDGKTNRQHGVVCTFMSTMLCACGWNVMLLLVSWSTAMRVTRTDADTPTAISWLSTLCSQLWHDQLCLLHTIWRVLHNSRQVSHIQLCIEVLIGNSYLFAGLLRQGRQEGSSRQTAVWEQHFKLLHDWCHQQIQPDNGQMCAKQGSNAMTWQLN